MPDNPGDGVPTRGRRDAVLARVRAVAGRATGRFRKLDPSRRGLAAAVVVALLAAGTVVYSTQASNAAGRYRTAQVVKVRVAQTISLAGTLTPVSSATVSFPIAGKVAKIKVKPGQSVEAGQVLAGLDTTSLRSKVLAARRTLANAELALQQLESGQDSTTLAAGGGSTGTSTRATGSQASDSGASGSTAGSSAGGKPSGAGASVAQLRKAVLATQRAIDSALAASKTALAQATAACGSGDGSASGAAGSVASSSPSASGSGSAAATGASGGSGTNGGKGGGEARDCAAGQEAVLAAQTEISRLQQLQASQMTRLNQALTASAAAATGQSVQSGAGTKTATAEQLAAAQAQIDAALAGVDQAVQNQRAATITAPIGGTVLSVGLRQGETASTTDSIRISGDQQYQATALVAVSKIASVKIGDGAMVTASGSSEGHSGSVATIGVSPATTSGTVTYPVTVTFDADQAELRDGASATVEITTADVDDAVSVPTSAIRTLGNQSLVTVLRDGVITTTKVTTGAIGSTYTQITEGLVPGQSVVLADNEQDVPASNSTGSRRFGSNGPAGLPGAGYSVRRS